MKMYRFIILSILTLVTNLSFSQDYTPDTTVNRAVHLYATPYTKAIGVKMYPSAITYKKFTKTNTAFEFLGYFSLDGFRTTILHEKYMPIEGNENLTWYIGYGGHLGIWSAEWVKTNNNADKSNISVGFDGIIGLDYKVKNSPLNISIDWQPSFSIIQAYFKNQGGIGIRYVIK